MPDTSPDYTLWAWIASAVSAATAWFARDLIPRLLGREEKLTLAEIEAQAHGTPSGNNLLAAFQELNAELRREQNEEREYLRAKVDAYRLRGDELERQVQEMQSEIERLRKRLTELELPPGEIRFLRSVIKSLGGDEDIKYNNDSDA